MKTPHAKALQSFARDLQWLLALRLGVQLATVWFFVWGVTVLVLRVFGTHNTFWLSLGLLGIAPLALFAAWQAKRQRAAFAKIRASYDRLNACGGVIMAEEAADMGAWQAQLPAASVPKFRWHSGRAMLLLCVSALFAATALLLPERLTQLGKARSLEIGQIVGQLQAEVKTLAQEKILPDKKADDLQKQLSQLQKDSSSFDPNKTWEALDHIKQSNSDEAKQAAEEALTKTESLTEAETLAKAMQQAADEGMNEATASQAAQDLASMLNAAKLEEGILNGKIPPELLAGLNGLNKEQMQKLLSALELNKNALSLTASNLANLKMIDPAMLAKLQKAGQTYNAGALADYLSTCTNSCDSALLFSWLKRKPGGGRGGPGADMTWDNNTSEKDQKFQEHALPPASHLDDAQLVGVSKAAPELSGNVCFAITARWIMRSPAAVRRTHRSSYRNSGRQCRIFSSAMKNEKKILGLPTETNFGGSLDAKSAWKNFGGLDLNAAYKRFCENPLNYQEDFMFMDTTAFEFYFPVIDRYLRENRSDELFDDSLAWILGRGVLLQMSVPISRGLLKQIKSLCVYVHAHLSQYSPLSVEQGEIDDTWLEIEQRIMELEGASTVK